MKRPLLKSAQIAWASPNTLVGLMFVTLAIATRGRVRYRNGAIEAYGGAVTWFLKKALYIEAGAMTLGHVSIGQSEFELDRCAGHERIHVAQCQRWGPLFMPMYGLSTFLAWRRGDCPYRGNIFEREAYGKFPV